MEVGEDARQGDGVSHRLALSEIIVGERHRQDMGDLDALAASIAARGLMHPIVVAPDRTLIAGQRRLEAVRRLGWAAVAVTMIDVDDLLLAERDENAERKDFTPSEAVAIGRIIEERHRAKVTTLKPKWRAMAAEARRGNTTKVNELRGEAPRIGQARDAAANAVGMSSATYHRAKTVVAAAEADPETFGDLPEQMDKTGNVLGAFAEMEHRKAKAGIKPTTKAAERHAVHRNTRHLNADKIMENSTRSLEGIALALEMLNVDELNPARRGEWAASLARSLKSIQRIQKEVQHG